MTSLSSNVDGESDLVTLLASMAPALHDLPYVFCSVDPEICSRLPFEPLATFREKEGLSVIVTRQQARDRGGAHGTVTGG